MEKIIQQSLFGANFDIILNNDKTDKIIKKLKKPKDLSEVSTDKFLKSKNISIEEKIKRVTEDVNRILGNYKNDTIVIKSEDELKNYIDKAISNGVISVDTETNNSLDPLTCKIMGLCIYTPGEKNAYVPVNHINLNTKEKLPNQVTEEEINHQLTRLLENKTKCIFHNGKFDYMVIYYTCGVKLPIDWDTMIGSQILNENEPAGLKYQYKNKINPDQDKYSIEHLFQGMEYAIFDPELFALYAATDAYMTYKLYEYQKKEFEKNGNERLYNLFLNIEMPVVTVTAEMESRGIAVDKEFAKRLSTKFHKKLDNLNEVISKEMEKYQDTINEWRLSVEANRHEVKNGKTQKSLSEKLSDPVELTSATQLGILLYDVLRVLKVGSDGKKTTDEATLLSIKDTLPLASLILKKREYEKYLGTYIDVLPTYCNPRDGRVHAHFNQLGREDRNVVTGRMSSSDPSLQVIPARGDIVTVRMMFVATTEYPEIKPINDHYEVPIENEVLLKNNEYKWSSYLEPGDILENGNKVSRINVKEKLVEIYYTGNSEVLKTRRRYKLCGNDYSAQEVRMFAQNTQDPSMINVFKEGRDLYSEVASMVYHLPYYECTEFNDKGEFNLEGKQRRTKCKSLILGLQYGRGIKSIAEQIKAHDGPVNKEDIAEAKKLSDDFFTHYPKAKEWMDNNKKKAREVGYVEDLWGRRRRLPDASLPKYEFSLLNEKELFNPLLNTPVRKLEVDKKLINRYTELLDKTRSLSERESVIKSAKKDNLSIKSNSGYIAQAERQAINAPIQGGSATMTKLAMRNMYYDQELRDLDFHLLIPVHDEIIAEAPLWNIDKAVDRMAYIMIHAGEPECEVQMKCDGDSFYRWYEDVFKAHVKEEFEEHIKNGFSKEEAIKMVQEVNSECTIEEIEEYISELNL